MTIVHDLSPLCACNRLCPQLVKCHVNESQAFSSWLLSGELTAVFVWRTSTLNHGSRCGLLGGWGDANLSLGKSSSITVSGCVYIHAIFRLRSMFWWRQQHVSQPIPVLAGSIEDSQTCRSSDCLSARRKKKQEAVAVLILVLTINRSCSLILTYTTIVLAY